MRGLNRQPCNRAWRPVGFTSAVSPPVLMDECKSTSMNVVCTAVFTDNTSVCDAHPLVMRSHLSPSTSHVPVCETRRVAVSLHRAWDGPRRWDPSYSDGRISEQLVSSEQLLNRGPKNSGLPQNISKRKTQPMISAFYGGRTWGVCSVRRSLFRLERIYFGSGFHWT